MLSASGEDLAAPNLEEMHIATAEHLAVTSLRQQLALQVQQLSIMNRADGLPLKILQFVSLEPEERLAGRVPEGDHCPDSGVHVYAQTLRVQSVGGALTKASSTFEDRPRR